MAAKTEPTERQSAGAAAGSDDQFNQLRAVVEQLGLQPLDEPVERDVKRRGSRRRYLVAILIGVAATLAWQSYGEPAKQIIATRAPELGWSPDAKQMIASWVHQIGWTKPPASPEKQALPVAQAAPTAPSIDPEKVQQMTRDLATLRQTVEQLATGQEQVTRDLAPLRRTVEQLATGQEHVTQKIGKLEVADMEILAKITPAPPPPRPIAAPARKPTPTAPPPSRAQRPPPHP